MLIFDLRFVLVVIFGLISNILAEPCYDGICGGNSYGDKDVTVISIGDYDTPFDLIPSLHYCNKVYCPTINSCPPGYYIQYANFFNHECCDTCVSYSDCRADCVHMSCGSAVCDVGEYLVPADGVTACCSYCAPLGSAGNFCDASNPCEDDLNCIDDVCKVNCPAILCSPPMCNVNEIYIQPDYITNCCGYCEIIY